MNAPAQNAPAGAAAVGTQAEPPSAAAALAQTPETQEGGSNSPDLSLYRIHKVLGHPLRYRMMLELCKRPRSLTELVDIEWGTDINRLQEQIARLREVGVIEFAGTAPAPKGGPRRRLWRAKPGVVECVDGRLQVNGHKADRCART